LIIGVHLLGKALQFRLFAPFLNQRNIPFTAFTMR